MHYGEFGSWGDGVKRPPPNRFRERFSPWTSIRTLVSRFCKVSTSPCGIIVMASSTGNNIRSLLRHRIYRRHGIRMRVEREDTRISYPQIGCAVDLQLLLDHAPILSPAHRSTPARVVCWERRCAKLAFYCVQVGRCRGRSQKGLESIRRCEFVESANMTRENLRVENVLQESCVDDGFCVGIGR